jgi:vanillate O-demethylase ferredoxin subunit
VEDATHSILLAGGIGITPIVTMAERLHALGRDFVLHYAARSADRAAFREHLARAPFASRVRFHHSGGDPARRLDIAAALGAHGPGRHLYACGPAGLLDAVRCCASAAGWPSDAVHFERFQGVGGRCAGDEGFDVVIRSSGAVFRVEAGQSVADALRSKGIPVATSCEQGVCGTCLTGVLEGSVEHRDLFLTPEEQDRGNAFLPCVSRARSAQLVLDL